MDTTLSLFRAAARLAGAAGPSDAELLDRFVTGRDGDAFAVLVERHGPMVLAVCRRVLGPGPDADDAFQGAFLVLVRRAAAVRDRGRLAGWLYGVAYRTALEARSVRARRFRREPPTHPVPDAPAAPAPDASEVGPALERELARLPEKLRTAVALCDLDGRPRAEAAALLGVPEGTLSSRLAAGRKLLSRRLARFGPIGAASTATVLSIPAGAAAAILDGGTPAARALASGVLTAMRLAKLKLWAVVPVLAAAVAVGGWGVRADPPTTPAAAVAAVDAAPEAAADRTVKDAPPVVVKTVPTAGADDVDPATKEVRVTFSKEMADGSWSWSTAGDFGDFPKDNGAIRYDKDKKTCVLPVKLEPGTTYAIWVNSERFGNFKDADGRPAVPYLLVFQTKK